MAFDYSPFLEQFITKETLEESFPKIIGGTSTPDLIKLTDHLKDLPKDTENYHEFKRVYDLMVMELDTRK